MWSKIIKQSWLVDAAMLASLSYATTLLVEQLKPGFFSNSMDINLILSLAVVLIVLVVVLKPVYTVSMWVVGYYGLWCLALLSLFAKLVTGWLGWTYGPTLALVWLVSGLLALASYVNQHNQHHG
jgi:hypothetical protein